MKFNLLLLSLSLLSVACVKTESKKVEMPVIKKADPFKITKKGLRCELLGAESKDIFMEVSEKDGQKKINLYDFQDAERISILGAVIEGFQTYTFTMEESEEMVDEENIDDVENKAVMTGSSLITKTKDAVIDVEGSVMSSKATLFLDNNNNGNLVITHKVRIDNSYSTVDAANSVSIENCEAFEARTL